MDDKMHKMKVQIDCLCEIEEKLTEWTKHHIDMGCKAVDTEEMGKVVDMIKDIAKTKKECWEAAYYEAVTAAMHEGDEAPEMPWFFGPATEKAGYDRYRYPSSGRFAPTGRGRRMGYIPEPFLMNPDHWAGEEMMENPRMGYAPNTQRQSSGGMTHPIDQYRDARRFYTETGRPDAKQKADMHAEEHMEETVETVKEIWKDADPSLRQKMKTDVTKLLNEMTP